MRLKSCGVASRTTAKGKFWGKLRARKAVLGKVAGNKGKKINFEKITIKNYKKGRHFGKKAPSFALAIEF